MSINVSKIARQIANKLDATDKDGSNGKIEKDTWNTFAQGKGKSIQRYIGINDATKSISIYLNREAKRSGDSVSDIGDKWINGSYETVIQKEVTLKEIVVCSNKPPKQDLTYISDDDNVQTQTPVTEELVLPSAEDMQAQAAAQITQTPKPSEEPDLAEANPVVNTDEGESVEEVPVVAEAPKEEIQAIQSSADAEKDLAVLDENVTIDNSIEPQETDNLGFFRQFTEEDKNFYERLKIQNEVTIALMPIAINYRDVQNMETMIVRISNVVSLLDADNINTASVIKIIKDKMLKDIKKAFGYNERNSYRFIYTVAQAINRDVADKNKKGSRADIVSTAQSYCDAGIKSDREGNSYLSGGRNRAWCADTVSTILKDSLEDLLPSDFGTAAVSNLRTWGKKHDCYTETSRMGARQRQDFIANNVKIGDIMIEKRNGKSHTGIVVEIAEDGSWFKTVEGNASNSVATRTYLSNSKTLSGFVSMEQFVSNEQDNNLSDGEIDNDEKPSVNA